MAEETSKRPQRGGAKVTRRSRHPSVAGPASKTELIRLRVEPEFKARVEAEAARRGMSVSAWITGLMKRSLRAS